ncbi:MAG: hypothetical protein ACRC8Y_22895 [Chroococcales cyanobacterium]
MKSLNSSKSLSGIETLWQGCFDTFPYVSMALNPFQGLKLTIRVAMEQFMQLSMALNPFQGLKQ